MGFALRHIPNYTYNEYKHWEGKWELISGIPYAMSPSPVFKHQKINTRIITQLENKLKGCKHCNALMPIDWVIDEHTVVQPDALVVCGPIGGKFLSKAPSVIFEILSPSTAQKDRTAKLELYEYAQVPYYVIVNPDNDTAEIYLLKDGKYNIPPKYVTKESFKFTFNTCKLNFDFSKIW